MFVIQFIQTRGDAELIKKEKESHCLLNRFNFAKYDFFKSWEDCGLRIHKFFYNVYIKKFYNVYIKKNYNVFIKNYNVSIKKNYNV